MKKPTDIYSNLIYGLCVIAIGLFFVSLPVLSGYINDILTNKQMDFSIQKQITDFVLAFSTIILVAITVMYAKSTKDLVDEQVKLRQVASIEKVLENIYSPIIIALNRFMLNCESLPENRIPVVYNNEFKDLNAVIMNIASKYYHLINQEILNYYSFELWKVWLQYSNNPDIDNYKLLNSRIKMFGDYITKQLNLEKESLNKLQQLGEKMNADETQNDCPLSTKEWVSFLNSEISNLKNEGFQNSNSIFPPMNLFAVLATAMITWMLSVANGNTPQDFKAYLISLFGKFQVLLIILFIVIVLVYIYSLFIYKLNKWKADKLKDIRDNIMNGGLKDTNDIHKKWSNVSRLTYKEYIKKFF